MKNICYLLNRVLLFVFLSEVVTDLRVRDSFEGESEAHISCDRFDLIEGDSFDFLFVVLWYIFLAKFDTGLFFDFDSFLILDS